MALQDILFRVSHLVRPSLRSEQYFGVEINVIYVLIFKSYQKLVNKNKIIFMVP